MMHRIWLILTFFIVITRLELAVSGEPNYPILDSKFPAAEAKLGWLDNEHVIFHGYEVGKFGQKSPDDGHEIRETGLFIWDIPQNKVTKYWTVDGRVGICVFRGTVVFRQRAKPGQNIWNVVTGNLEGAQQRKEDKKVWLNGTSCRLHEEQPEWAVQDGHRRWGLLEEHGYLDFGLPSRADLSKASPILLYPPKQNPKTLPFTGEQVRFHLGYFEFADVYLLERHQETTYATHIWQLKPDGTVSDALKPTGEQWEKLGWGQYSLTKKGLFSAGGSGSYNQVGTTGGYLFLHGNKPVRLIEGLTRNISVSPDGCKVAFVHVLHSQAGADSFRSLLAGKPGTRTLKMIDLCAGKGE